MGLRVGGITFSGIASGLPTDEIIDKLLDLERRPIDLLENQKADFETRLGIYQDLNTKILSLSSALGKIDNVSSKTLSDIAAGQPSEQSPFEEFKQFTAASSDEDVLTATASSAARPGSISIRVDTVASGQRDISTQSFTNLTDTVGTGNFRLTVAGTDTDITVDATNNTVSGLVGAINDSAADVTAFAMNDGSATPYKIMIMSNQTGATQAVSYTIDPGISLSFVTTQSPTNAAIVIDPGANQISAASTTNTFASVLPGLTFEVKQTSATVQTIDVDEDQDKIVENIQAVVSAYNDIMDVINEQAKVDPTTNRGGPLLGDSTLLGLQRRLSGVVASSIGTGNITSAALIGIELDSEGKLSVDETKLKSNAASSLDDVAEFFAGVNSFADQMGTIAFVYSTTDGLLDAKINGTTDSIADLESEINDAEDRLGVIEENLVRQFTTLETQISRIQAQGNFLNQFLLSQVT